jgi:type IV secretion system protein VirD4
VEVGISFGICFFCFGICIAWFCGGLARYLSLWIAIATLLIALFLSLGVIGFLSYEGLPLMSLNEFLSLLQSSSVPYNHLIIALVISLSSLIAILTSLVWERLRPESHALGNAHFANGVEIAKANLFKKEKGALLIGKKYGRPLWSNGDEHVLVFASSGSGKTRSISIPNLFQYPYSVVCNDVKLTLFKTTSGYREKVLGQTCYLWAPTLEKTHRFNPLSFISNDKKSA